MDLDKKYGYRFLRAGVLRTPMLPLKDNFEKDTIIDLIQHPVFKEAIYLASPSLYEKLEKYLAGTFKEEENKFLTILQKYIVRMHRRATPFGLFATSSVIEFEQKDNQQANEIIQTKKIERNTRLDMYYLCALSHHLLKIQAIKKICKFHSNNTIYTIGDKLRYIEYLYQKKAISFQIATVDNSADLQAILAFAKAGVSYSELVNFIITHGTSFKNAEQTINQLIEAGLLLSELAPRLDEKNYLQRIVQIIQTSNIEDSINQKSILFAQILQSLQHLDADISNATIAYQSIVQLVKQIVGLEVEEDKLFHVDTYRVIEKKIALPKQLLKELQEALNIINCLTEPSKMRIDEFKKAFYERFEDESVSLLLALDVETGISYNQNKEANLIAPLIEGLFSRGFENDSLQLQLSGVARRLFTKLLEAQQQNQKEVVLTQADVKDFKSNWKDLPNSMNIFFTLFQEDGLQKMLLNGVNGHSLSLLGRYSINNAQFKELCQSIAKAEKQLMPHAIHADIRHLPEARTGNVTAHDALREYEIPCLVQSSLADEYQIKLSDLYISIVNDKIRLYSQKLGKEILPRLSNAHNYVRNTMPVYQFLCDLSYQGVRPGLSFSWGNCQGLFSFLPRVRYKNIILTAAQWNLTQKDCQILLNQKDELSDTLQVWRKQFNIPSQVNLVKGDNVLFINFENELSTLSFLDSLKKSKNGVVLQEVLIRETPIKDENDNCYHNEFILPMIKEKVVVTNSSKNILQTSKTDTVQRYFSIGSEWLYFKLYCGYKVGTKVLVDRIQPLANELLKKGVIKKWFFIRYGDPELHLRIRFLVNDKSSIQQVIALFHKSIQSLLADKLVHKIQLDTYKREIERYGLSTIHFCESLFCNDSIIIVNFFKCTAYKSTEDSHWLFGVALINRLLDNFGLSLVQKSQLLQSISQSYLQEFNADKFLKKELNNRFRGKSSAIENILKGDKEEVQALLKQKTTLDQPIIEKIQLVEKKESINIIELLPSLLHMSMVRLMEGLPRQQELVVYYFLAKYYKSAIARAKYSKKVTADEVISIL